MKEIIIGSGQDCHYTLLEAGVSGRHLRLREVGDGIHFIIEDLNSTNGSFVNNRQISGPTTITYNDQILLGAHLLNLETAISILWGKGQEGSKNQKKNRGSSHNIIAGPKIIGREAPAEIILAYPFISTKHLRISQTEQGLLFEDVGSSNGTFINGERLQPGRPVSFKSSDILVLGSFQVPPYLLQEWKDALQPSSNTKSESSILKRPITIRDGVLKIGRDPSSDICIEHPTVSWNHATLTVKGDKWVIKDEKSSNGTFVDGSSIRMATIDPSRDLRIGSVDINLTHSDSEKTIFEVVDPTKGVRVYTKNLVRTLSNGRRILDDITLSIYPSEMVALMGPSGAGKTTLLDMLTGLKRPTSGVVLYNGTSLFDNWEKLRHSIGYVPQEDIMHRDLTVYETLYNAAKLRLPADSPESYIRETVEKLLRQMDLEMTRDTLIGDENRKGISGGQRKRVNIALELITEPPLLFLDEPTSGLDATSTLKVLSLLRGLADEGKTIVMTIHQPRIEVFEMMNNLILLTKGGKLAYYGPTKNVQDYFNGKTTLPMASKCNPADYVMDLLDPVETRHAKSADQWKQFYLQSSYKTKYVDQRLEEKSPENSSTKKIKRSAIKQFFVLFRRYFIRKKRDTSALMIQLLQAPIIGILLAWIFLGAWNDLSELVQDRKEFFTKIKARSSSYTFNFDCSDFDSIRGVTVNCSQLAMEQLQNGIHPSFFLLAAAAFWFGCSNVAKELVSERAIYNRERRVGLRSISYLSSIFAYQVLIVSLQVFLLVFIVGMALGPLPFEMIFTSFVILLITAVTGISLGLAISSISKTDVAAISVIPIVLLPQLILGGYVSPFLNFSSIMKFVSSMMPIRWSFSSLLISSYQDICKDKEMGCFCEEGDNTDQVFGETCLKYENTAIDGTQYHEGYILDLEEVLGFADSAEGFTWTISSGTSGIILLLSFIFIFSSFTLFTISKRSQEF